jgi:hypothetical protein
MLIFPHPLHVCGVTDHDQINRLELNMETLKETRQGREDRMQKVKVCSLLVWAYTS